MNNCPYLLCEGQFYVMMSPQDVLQTGPRNIAPRATLSPVTLAPNRTIRDERRRTSHNEGTGSARIKFSIISTSTFVLIYINALQFMNNNAAVD